MLKTLLSINSDLGSSIAVRYARELSNFMEIQLYGIHVIDPEKLGHAPGSGWVRRTWENALIETKKEEIIKFLDVEKTDSAFLRNPKILIGDRTEKLSEELHKEEYHLFLEGVLPTSNPTDFHKLIHSRLYRMLPCPVLVVKNLLTPSKAAILFDDRTDVQGFSSTVSTLFKNTKFTIDPVYLKFGKSNDSTLANVANSDIPIKDFKQSDFKASGVAKVIEGSPKTIAEWLREYGLIISSLDHMTKKNDAIIELLSLVPSPVLVCWQ